ncbi:MAG: tetratricopeptide repeat protein [Chitinophagaceae bacterium]|nr:tetratricopeptide repeat protein [Chitinophagaceae bacterium]
MFSTQRHNEYTLTGRFVLCLSGINTPALAFVSILAIASPQKSIAGRTDSLKKILQTTAVADTSRAQALLGMAWEYKNKNTNTDSIRHYAGAALKLSAKIGYTRGEALGNMYEGIADVLDQNYEKAQANLMKALAVMEKQPPSKDVNELLHNIGLVYYMQTKFPEAIAYFERSKKSAKDIGNDSRVARAYFYLGDIYNDIGNFAASLKEYLGALKIYETLGATNSASNCYTNIATLYAQLKDFDKAREYVAKSMKSFETSTNQQEVYQNYANIGFVYSLMQDYTRALELFNRGLKLTDSMGDEYWNTVFLTNVAETYTTTKQPAKALAAYEEVLKRQKTVPDVNFVLSAHSGMGRILFEQGKKKEGVAHLQEALKLMQQTGQKKLAMETSGELANMYEATGDYKKALELSHTYERYKDSIFNADNERKIQKIQYDHDLEKKQLQIRELKKTHDIQASFAKKLEIALGILIVSKVLLITMLVLFYRKKRSEKRAKEKVQGQKEQLQLQASRLEELNHFKDKTFSVLSHDLRGPINSITAAIQMLNNKQLTAEEYDMLKPDINNQLSTLNLLLDNVLMWARSYMQETKASDPAPTDIAQLIGSNLSLLGETAERKQITLSGTTGAPVMAFCDGGQINIVLRNLIMNALKFTGAGGTVSVQCTSANGKVRIAVTDTGVGMDAEQLESLFTAKDGRNTYGTEGERGIGLGLLLCHEFVRVNDGTIEVQSEKGKGSTFTVTLPAA